MQATLKHVTTLQDTCPMNLDSTALLISTVTNSSEVLGPSQDLYMQTCYPHCHTLTGWQGSQLPPPPDTSAETTERTTEGKTWWKGAPTLKRLNEVKIRQFLKWQLLCHANTTARHSTRPLSCQPEPASTGGQDPVPEGPWASLPYPVIACISGACFKVQRR